MSRSTPDYRRIGLAIVGALIAAFLPAVSGLAQSPQMQCQDLAFSIDGRSVSVHACRPSSQQQVRAAAILLHGRGGFGGAFAAAYERYAHALAHAGIEAYLLPYYDDADTGIMNSSDRPKRQSHFRDQIGKWSQRADQLATAILERADPPPSIGLVGFSNGGFVATAAAGASGKYAALVVLYGGLPDWLPEAVSRLPPTLAIHGEADHVIPIAEGEKLVEIAHRLGAQAELVRVPDADHGFDLGKDDDRSDGVRRRVVDFLAANLKKP